MRISDLDKIPDSRFDKREGVCKFCSESENIRDRSVFDKIYDKKFCYTCNAWTELIEKRHFGKKDEDFDEYGELLSKFDLYTGKLHRRRSGDKNWYKRRKDD